ncbi:hypothetical protein [Algicola sagamiensis]|uniref:hypothetical protein n=1 Tax=Algicola sagamiensis TaxID=163869 RepID=UPI00039DDD2B|nr:hypothetical protein [Algicola sagamiensis]
MSSLQTLYETMLLNPAQKAMIRNALARLNKMKHIFDKKAHKLDDYLKACGNRDNALDKMEDAFRNATKGRSNGPVELEVDIDGFKITIRGAVVDGKVKIGTAFIP